MRKRTAKRISKSRTTYAKKAGHPPGSIVYTGEIKVEKPHITLFDYDDQRQAEISFDNIDASRAYQRTARHLWLNVHGLHETKVMAEIGQRFGLHPLVLEDILNPQQRPKLDEYESYSFVTLRTFRYEAEHQDAISEQISLILGKDFLLSFQERPSGLFEPIRNRLRQGQGGHLRPEALFHALIDAVVDQYFVVVEALTNDVEQLEEQILTTQTRRPTEQINHFRHEVLSIRRAIWPLREVLAGLQRLPSSRLSAETQLYMRDVYDHTIHVIEHLDSLRDVIGSLFELHQANLNNRMNAEIRMLTVVTTVFAPAGVLTGFFGMNFQHMPWLENEWGWQAVCIMMITFGTLLITALFWRRWWVRENL